MTFSTAKRFGVTEIVDSNNCGDKFVSQVISVIHGTSNSDIYVCLYFCFFWTSRIEQVINEMTDGGADYCFECVGMASLVHEAYACCRKVCILGESLS